jgi:hypothetical protein
MRLEIGPVDVEAARCWLAHVIPSLAIVRDRQDRLPFRLPAEIADDIHKLLVTWRDHADVATDTFHWGEELDEEQVRLLVRYWANLDSMTDEQVRELGVDWSPSGGRPFFVALTTAVATALAGAADGADPFAELLVDRNDLPIHSVREP